MPTEYLIKNINIINENKSFCGSVYIRDNLIYKLFTEKEEIYGLDDKVKIINGKGKILIPGVIDTHVHFRDPGLTHKADLLTESKAAIAGGVTSFFDMPNTIPPVSSRELLKEKIELAKNKSLANFAFYIAATKDNIEELKKFDKKTTPGIKIFLGSSTGNLAVDNNEAILKIFQLENTLIAAHCEDDTIIKLNLENYKKNSKQEIKPNCHPFIRSEEACFVSSEMAIKLARQYNTRLHLLHISTEKEISLLNNSTDLSAKKITAEVCINYLLFDDSFYNTLGNLIKCNPSIKTKKDKAALLKALIDNYFDLISTDHAPHTLAEKEKTYLEAPSGIPSIQHSLSLALNIFETNHIPLIKLVEKMCHNPAICFKINKRGFIREGYYADLAILDFDNKWTADSNNTLYKCGWSPYDNMTFNAKVTHTFVNGNLVFEKGHFNETFKGKLINFDNI